LFAKRKNKITFLIIYDKNKNYNKDYFYGLLYNNYLKFKDYFGFESEFVLCIPNHLDFNIKGFKGKKIFFSPRSSRNKKTRYSNVIDGYLAFKKESKNTVILLEPDIIFIKPKKKIKIDEIYNKTLFYKVENSEDDIVLEYQKIIGRVTNTPHKYNYYASGAVISHNSTIFEEVSEYIDKHYKYYKINDLISLEEVYLSNKEFKPNDYIINYGETIKDKTFMIHCEDYVGIESS